MNLKDLAYQGHPVAFSVMLGGVDIKYVGGVSDISKSLDYPRLTEYRIGESTVSLNDPDGLFSPRNANNFFVQNGHSQLGVDVECEIEAGFIVDGTRHTETIFSGKIIKVSQDAKQSITKLLVSDAFNTLFRDKVTDIGIERRFHLDAEDSNDIHGFYPIADFVGPASKGSTTVDKAANTPLTEVEALSTIGSFDSDNYLLTDEGIKTEGGPAATATGYPQISMKSPYRHRLIKDVITEILTDLGITNANIVLPNVMLSPHFYSQGRFGYGVISTPAFIGSSADAKWTGYVTDFIWDTDRYYVLLNAHRGDLRSRSTLFSYNPTDYSYEVFFQSLQPSPTFPGTEFWKLAKQGNIIAILSTDSSDRFDDTTTFILPDYRALQPGIGSYDAAEVDNQIYIQYYDIIADTGVAGTAVAKDNQFRAQLAHNYLLGATDDAVLLEYQPDFSKLVRGTLPTKLPDTRRNLLWYNDELYYAYVDGNDTSRFGIATCNLAGDTTTSLFALRSDGSNHTGIAFDISGTTLICAYTRRKESGSNVHVFSRAL